MGLRMQPPNDEFFTPFTKASSKSAAILMEFAARAARRWAELARAPGSTAPSLSEVQGAPPFLSHRSSRDRRVAVFRVEPSTRTNERVTLVHVGPDGHFTIPLSPGRYVLEARNVLIAGRVHALFR